MVYGLWFRVQGLGFRVQGSGFRVSELMAWCLVLRISDFRAEGLGVFG